MELNKRALGWLGVLVGACVSASLALISVAGAAPLAGGTHFNETHSDNPFVQVSALGCPIFGGGHADGTGPFGANISIHLNGWAAAYLDTPFLSFRSTADVKGTIVDAGGQLYTVSGHFSEDAVRADVGDPFIGTGRLKVSGPGGTIMGDATLADLTAPPEVDLSFDSVAICSTH
jgi:hypothetical protein